MQKQPAHSNRMVCVLTHFLIKRSAWVQIYAKKKFRLRRAVKYHELQICLGAVFGDTFI